LVKAKVSISWHAQWITATQSQSATNTWISFRKEINLDAPPDSAITRIAVDSKYWLWINGEMVVFEGGLKRGPNPQDTYYDEIDIAPYLKKGRNTIAVLVWYFGKNGFSHNSSGQAGMVFEADIPGQPILSDGSWQAVLNLAYEQTNPPIPNYRLAESNVRYNAQNALGNWQDENYQASKHGFAPARELGRPPIKPWNHLIKRPIPQWRNYGLKEYENVQTISGKGVDTVICKLPYNAQITPYFKIKSDAGERINIKTDHYTGGGPYNVRAEYITRNGEQEYESYGWMNGRKVYYIIPEDAKILNLKYRETGYNTRFEGNFESSDPFLNRLWKKARRTLYITMRDTYMDCPDRERAQWWGDEVNESGEAFYALGPKSHLLQKKGMYELIGWQRKDSTLFAPIPAGNWDKELPGQMLASIGYYGFWNYYRYTGDLETIADLYEGVKKYLSVWKLKKNGTLHYREGDWNWGDWGDNIDRNVLENAWYYLALKSALNMARTRGKNYDAESYQAQMNRLEKSFNEIFWTGNAYRSPDYEGETDDRAQALAVVSGLAGWDKYPALYKIFQREEHASPYMEKYVLEALFQMGHGDYALQRMKKRFGRMVNDPHYSTLWEGWGIGTNGFGGGTTNHAWSGGGLTILSQYLTGISPLQPGYKSIEIMPHPAGIQHASATVASTIGTIKSSFQNTEDNFDLDVNIPKSSDVVVGIPDRDWKRISVNGKIIWKSGKYIRNEFKTGQDGNRLFLTFQVPGGHYIFKAEK